MSKSFQEIVEIFNPKKSLDKNINSKVANNKNGFNDKMPRMIINKVSDNKNNEKKIVHTFNKSYSNVGIEVPSTSERQETILLAIKNNFNPAQNDKKKSFEIQKNEPKNINKSEKKIDDFLLIDKNNLLNVKVESKEKDTMIKLNHLNDVNNFKEEDFKIRRYDKNNVNKIGKKFFKWRYINNKLTSKNNFPLNKEQDNNLDKNRILRKYKTDFILTVEKSILSFNIKNFKDSYEILKNSDIIKNIAEYGEILLVVSGFDKFLVGEFLAKQKYPNDKKEVLNNFIESINMKISENSFLDSLRFLFSRLILPKDANLILEIMDKFSVNFFDVNKEDEKFVETFKSSDKIYLLVSTILALNTMFTRKDIKIKNVIKKEEFIKMNGELSKDFLEKLYDELKKNPISMADDYNELIYKKLASFIKDDNRKDKKEDKEKLSSQLEFKLNNSNIEEKSKENVNMANHKSFENENKNSIGEETIDDEDDDNFNLKLNLDNLKEEDKIILNTPQKLYKITGTKKSDLREYVLSDDFTKIYYLKKPKKYLFISKLEKVFNGSDHNHNSNIKKYLKGHPSEEAFKGNFVSLIFQKKQLDLMSDDLDSVLKWYKAIKNLPDLYGNNNKKITNITNIDKFESEIRELTQNIWNIVVNKWSIYGTYLIMKLMERNKFTYFVTKESHSLDYITKLSYKNTKSFLKSVDVKITKEKGIEYNDFINLYYIGLPNSLRKSIWSILIGNPCGINESTYMHVKKKIQKINFKDLDLKNPDNKVYSSDNLSNKIIKDIIEVNNLFFKEEQNKEINKNLLMTKIFNIARSFFIFREDISYNKSFISIIYLLILVFDNEAETFSNLVNLICSNIFPIFIGDENELKIYTEFFNDLFEKYLPKIAYHFNKMEITPELYLIPWFEELFTRTFNLNILYHIFDIFLLNGEYILFQTALSIIKSLEDELTNLTINEALQTLQRIPDNISETYFMNTMINFPKIKLEVSAWKSQNDLTIQKSKLFINISI